MYFKVEKTGCSVRRGRVQVRYCFYLDPLDYGYEVHRVEVPIVPPEGYPGEMLPNGDGPVDIEDYEKWEKKLPTEIKVNPFHNHFVQLEPTVTDEDLLFVGEWACLLAKRNWDKGMDLAKEGSIKNEPLEKIHPDDITSDRIVRCNEKIEDIKSKKLEKLNVVDVWA